MYHPECVQSTLVTSTLRCSRERQEPLHRGVRTGRYVLELAPGTRDVLCRSVNVATLCSRSRSRPGTALTCIAFCQLRSPVDLAIPSSRKQRSTGTATQLAAGSDKQRLSRKRGQEGSDKITTGGQFFPYGEHGLRVVVMASARARVPRWL